MDWLNQIPQYSTKISIYNKNGIINAMNAIAWAREHFGQPQCEGNKLASWTIDAEAGYFVFYFENVEDCTLFKLTVC
jgi:hypothetical protein